MHFVSFIFVSFHCLYHCYDLTADQQHGIALNSVNLLLLFLLSSHSMLCNTLCEGEMCVREMEAERWERKCVCVWERERDIRTDRHTAYMCLCFFKLWGCLPLPVPWETLHQLLRMRSSAAKAIIMKSAWCNTPDTALCPQSGFMLYKICILLAFQHIARSRSKPQAIQRYLKAHWVARTISMHSTRVGKYEHI